MSTIEHDCKVFNRGQKPVKVVRVPIIRTRGGALVGNCLYCGQVYFVAKEKT